MSSSKISLALAFVKSHPESVAKILEQHDSKAVAAFIIDIPHSYASPVLHAMLPQQSAQLCKLLKPTAIAGILMHLPATRIVAILRHVSKEQRAAIVLELPTKVQISCALLLAYSTEMVGAWMTPHMFVVPYECTAAEAIAYTKNGNQHAYTDCVFAVDRDGLLKGRIRLTKLLAANADTYVSSIVEACSHTLKARSLIYPISKHAEWGYEEAIPVLNKDARLIGVLRHVDLRRYQAKPADNVGTQTEDLPITGLVQIYGHCLKALITSMKGCVETDIRS
jgi:Mg/Co/Ni transporter MgtE